MNKFTPLVTVFAVCTLFALGGCGLLEPGLPAGEYAGALQCRATVTDPAGMAGSDNFSMPVTLRVDDAGEFAVNNQRIVVGADVTRALPNADLSFEVLTVTEGLGQVDVTYAPRPTLPGIAVTGDLTENYRRAADTIRMTGRAQLILTDSSGDTMIDVDCSGSLPQQ